MAAAASSTTAVLLLLVLVAVNANEYDWDSVGGVLQSGIDTHVYPGCVAMVLPMDFQSPSPKYLLPVAPAQFYSCRSCTRG